MSVTNAALRGRIERLARKWVPILGLESWGLTFRYDEPKHLACCEVKGGYEEATIGFNLPRCRRELPNTLAAFEELVVHEMLHALLPRASEREVSRVTRSILRAHDAKR